MSLADEVYKEVIKRIPTAIRKFGADALGSAIVKATRNADITDVEKLADTVIKSLKPKTNEENNTTLTDDEEKRILSKLLKVFNSVSSPEQLKSAKKYHSLALKKLSAKSLDEFHRERGEIGDLALKVSSAISNKEKKYTPVDEGQIYSTGGGCGQSYRKFTPKVDKTGISQESAIMKGLVDEGDVVPFKRRDWEALPQQVRQLSAEWYWAHEVEDGPEMESIAAQLSTKGFLIDYDYDGENIELAHKKSNRRFLLPLQDADNFTGWAQGTEPRYDDLNEDLRKWFKEKWVRFGPDGKIRGACARGSDSEGKPKCLPQKKAHALGKKGRKYAAAKKRREDPNPERRGKAKNVATKKKSNEGVAEGSTGISVRKWAAQVRKDHGPDIKFWNRQEGGGAVDSVIAKNSQGEIVGVYNRKTGHPTVFAPRPQGVAEGSITEADKNPPLSKWVAYNRLEEIYNQVKVKNFTATPEEAQGLLADAKRMYKITGSRFPRYSNTVPSAGDYYNWIYRILDSVLSQHGQREFPSATNVRDFANGIAAYYHGDANWQKPIRWQNSSGGSRQEPEWTVMFKSEDIDDVWADLSKRGKTVYISDKMSKTPSTYLRFGSILVGKNAKISGVFSDNPERTDYLFFQSAKILRNDYYTQHEITPQQAHQIQDIAKTKNQNAMDMLKAMARALNEPKMDKALARVLDSTRIDPAFKAKLNQIIAGSKDFDDDFKEGVAEGNLKEFAPYSRDDDGDSRDIDPLREKIYSLLMKKLANVKGNPQDIAMAAMEVADDIASESEFVDFTKLPKWVEMVLNKVQSMAEGEVVRFPGKSRDNSPLGTVARALGGKIDAEDSPKYEFDIEVKRIPQGWAIFRAGVKQDVYDDPDRAHEAAKEIEDVIRDEEEQLDELKCWSGYTRVKGVPAGAPGSCKKKKTTSESAKLKEEYSWVIQHKDTKKVIGTFKNENDAVDQFNSILPEKRKKYVVKNVPRKHEQLTNENKHRKCPSCGGELVSEEMLNEKKDACYYKVKSRYKVWPSAYASGALVKCRKVGAKNWGKSTTKENKGLPMPGTYEQEYNMFKSKGPERIVAMTNEGDKDVAEDLEQQYLWHGSRQKIPMLEPRQAVDIGGAAGSNQNAIYATSDPIFATQMGMPAAGSDYGHFPNDPQMVLFSGKIRKGKNVYLHKLPFYGPDGKPQFVQGAHDREFYSIPGVKGIKPVEIKAVPVNCYLNLVRQATPQDLELRKELTKEGVAEAVAPSQKLRSSVLYHGTDTKAAYQDIVSQGLKYDIDPELRAQKYKGQENFAPLPGGIYLTTDFGNGVRYSFLSNVPDEQWAEYIKQEPYGYVFEFFGKDLTGVTADEDELGNLLQKLVNTKNLQPNLLKIVQLVPKELKVKLQQPNVDHKINALAGKWLVNNISDATMQYLVKRYHNVVNYSSMKPNAVWVIPKPTERFLRDRQGTFNTHNGFSNYAKKFGKRYDLTNEKQGVKEEEVTEKWSAKYKRSINCNNPKGFSQRAHCQGRKKKAKK